MAYIKVTYDIFVGEQQIAVTVNHNHWVVDIAGGKEAEGV